MAEDRTEGTDTVEKRSGCLTVAIGLSALSAILSLLRFVPFWLLSYQHESCCSLGLPTWAWAVGIGVQASTLAALVGVWRRRRWSVVVVILLYPIWLVAASLMNSRPSAVIPIGLIIPPLWIGAWLYAVRGQRDEFS